MGTTTPRRVRVSPRSSTRWQARWFPSPDGRERIGVIDSGINIVIEQLADVGTVDISTDRLVFWTPNQQVPDITRGDMQTGDVPLEFYMEGNIVFRQADRVIYADRMYYNVQGEYGVVLNGEMLTPIPGYDGLVRLKADVLKQVDRHRFEGYTAAVTTSRLGVPGYWLQSGSFQYEELPVRLDLPPPVDPLADQPRTESRKYVTSRQNQVYFGGWPVFWWPFMSGDLERPTYYLESLSINNDSVFGTQVLTDWNLYQLLGFHRRRRAPTGQRPSITSANAAWVWGRIFNTTATRALAGPGTCSALWMPGASTMKAWTTWVAIVGIWCPSRIRAVASWVDTGGGTATGDS